MSSLRTETHENPGQHRRVQKLVVILPALNEERTVGQVVRAIPRSIPGIDCIEAVVVDDGSTDSTGALAAEAGAHVIRHPSPRGVGAGFLSGLRYALSSDADMIVNIDSDGQFNPADIPKLMKPVLDDQADFTTASRFKDPALLPNMPGIKLWGNRMMSRLISGLTGQKFHDVSCGMRCYSRTAALHLNLIGQFTYTQEVFLNMAFKHFRILEVPIKVRGQREHGKSRVASNLFRYALNTSRIIFQCYRDYFPLRFFSAISVCLTIPALILLGFLLQHYLATGEFSPHKWTGFSAGILLLLAALSLHLGIIGDMLNRHRVYLEETLVWQRSRHQKPDTQHDQPSVPIDNPGAQPRRAA